MKLIHHLLSLPPRETWRLVRGRIPVLRNAPAWRPMDLLTSPKHRNGIRFAELLLRQEAVVRRHMRWEPLNFDGARVVEIGCGPLGGYGPLAIFRGAASFESAEPEWDDALFASDIVIERYFRVLHADLTALYGERMSFDEYRQAMQQRMTIYKTGFDTAPLKEKADIVLSQSCLEHVFPLEPTIRKLASIQTRRTRFLHLVDFGNHYLTANPFEGLYEQPPDAYIARRGKAINLARSSDIAALFKTCGITAEMIPARVVRETYNGTVSAWWRGRYDEEALFTQLVLMASPHR